MLVTDKEKLWWNTCLCSFNRLFICVRNQYEIFWNLWSFFISQYIL